MGLPIPVKMPLSSATRLIEVLRATLLEVEQTSGVSSDDPSMAKLKSILVQRIADLEAERAVEEVASGVTALPPEIVEAQPAKTPSVEIEAEVIPSDESK